MYTPPGYQPTAGPYPLVVLLDGAAYVSNRFGNAPTTLDNLINDGRIRPAIVLFDPRIAAEARRAARATAKRSSRSSCRCFARPIPSARTRQTR